MSVRHTKERDKEIQKDGQQGAGWKDGVTERRWHQRERYRQKNVAPEREREGDEERDSRRERERERARRNGLHWIQERTETRRETHNGYSDQG